MNFKPLTLVNLGHHSLLLAILLLCTFSTAVEAQSSRAVPLPVFTVTDQPAVEKGAFLAAPPSWRPTSSMQPSAVSPDAIALTSGRWQTYGPGWTLAGNRAEIVHTPAGTPSYLVSPAFRVPEGRQLLRYSEKFSLESYRDYGSVWILAEDDSSWRKVHTLTGGRRLAGYLPEFIPLRRQVHPGGIPAQCRCFRGGRGLGDRGYGRRTASPPRSAACR